MLVVVFPSPAGVGVMAETRMSFDRSFLLGRVRAVGSIFAMVCP
jgi:hypothetical protein